MPLSYFICQPNFWARAFEPEPEPRLVPLPIQQSTKNLCHEAIMTLSLPVHKAFIGAEGRLNPLGGVLGRQLLLRVFEPHLEKPVPDPDEQLL